MGVVRRDCVGVVKGERWGCEGRGGVTTTMSGVVCRSGEPPGEGGGVGAMERRCFSATELSRDMRVERKVGTSWVMRERRASRRVVVRRSERGLPNSSEAVCSSCSPTTTVSSPLSNYTTEIHYCI